MPRFRLFGRKQADQPSALPADEQHPHDAGSLASVKGVEHADLPGDPLEDEDPTVKPDPVPDEDLEDADIAANPVLDSADDPLLAADTSAEDLADEHLPLDAPAEAAEPGGARKYLDLVQPSPQEDAVSDVVDTAAPAPAGDEPVTAESVLTLPLPEPMPGLEPASSTESKTLIGGREEDLVPLIPDTDVDMESSAEPDDASVAAAAVEALQGACALLVARTNKIRTVHDSTQIVSGLIALINDLDARYAHDWGIVRRNGLEEVLVDVRRSMAEGDRFILESLENGRGGLTADAFLRDLKTIAPSDRPRMIGHYIAFLAFVIKRVLHQYLHPLAGDEPRTRHLMYGVDHLVDGVRDVLLARAGRTRS